MNIERNISEIELCDWYINEEYNTTTLYFSAPLGSLTVAIEEVLKCEYPEAESMTISLEFPTLRPEAYYTVVCYSPTVYDPEDDSYSDVDWRDIDMPDEDITKLFKLAEPMKVLWERRGQK